MLCFLYQFTNNNKNISLWSEPKYLESSFFTLYFIDYSCFACFFLVKQYMMAFWFIPPSCRNVGKCNWLALVTSCWTGRFVGFCQGLFNCKKRVVLPLQKKNLFSICSSAYFPVIMFYVSILLCLLIHFGCGNWFITHQHYTWKCWQHVCCVCCRFTYYSTLHRQYFISDWISIGTQH